jgi:hypothetical protein
LVDYKVVDGKLNLTTVLGVEQTYLDKYPKNQKYNIAENTSGGRGPMTIEERDEVSLRMIGVNIGRAPINKGTRLTKAALDYQIKASKHRSFPVYIYDHMYNLITMYPSISESVRIERTQKNKFIAHIKHGTLWRGFYISKVKR